MHLPSMGRAPVLAASMLLLAGMPLSAVAQALLSETVVTALRVPTRSDEVLSDVVVLDRQTFEQASGRSLSELLARHAGLQMTAVGGAGQTSSLFVRGTESRHVLLLVDGVRYGSATLGSAVWDNIPVDMIERVEVLKGPASALYGSAAVGGVVQVFTRRAEPGFHPEAGLTLGSHGHRHATAGLAGGTASLSYRLSLGQLREHGFSATNPRVDFGNHNPDRDGFDQDSVSLALSWTPAPGWRSSLSLSQSDGTARFDAGPGDFDTRHLLRARVLGWELERRWSPGSRTVIKLARSQDQSSSFLNSPEAELFDTTQQQWGVEQEWQTAWGSLLLGLESLRESVAGTQAYAVNSRHTRAGFAGLTGGSGQHLWQLSLRRDRNSQFGDADTGFVSYGYQLTPQWRPRLSYGTSFKAPSFNTLYYVSPFFTGNPSTQPERGRNREVGLSYTRGTHEWSAVRFDNRVRGFISLQQTANNVPRARMQGWGLNYQATAGAWRWGGSVEWLDAHDEASGRMLPGRARHTLNAQLERDSGAWRWGAAWLASSARYNDADNKDRLAGFATLDLHASHRLTPAWSIRARLNNLADKRYETVKGYQQAGRTVYLGLHWQPPR
jgi:vitamin B12 transporter